MGSVTERALHATRLPLLIVWPADMVDKGQQTQDKAKAAIAHCTDELVRTARGAALCLFSHVGSIAEKLRTALTNRSLLLPNPSQKRADHARREKRSWTLYHKCITKLNQASNSSEKTVDFSEEVEYISYWVYSR